MSRKLATLMTFAAVCLVAVRSVDAQRPGGNARPQFSVVASGENVILLDQREGRTWLLTHSPAGGTPAWVPIQQINSPEEAEQWRREQHTLAEQRQREHQEHRQRETTKRLDERRREMEQRRDEFEQRARRERTERQKRQQGEDEVAPSVAQDAEGPGMRESLQQLGERTQRAMMKSLQQHRQRLIEQFGEDHPAVKSIGEQIERLSRELKKVTGESEEPQQDRKDAKQDTGSSPPPPEKKTPQRKEQEETEESGLNTIRKQLEAVKRQVDELLSERRDGALSERLRDLLVKEKLLLESHGPDHPDVRSVRIEIEAIRSVTGDASASDKARTDNEAETTQDAERQDEAKDGSDERTHQEEEASSDAAPFQADDIRRPPVEGALKRFRLQLEDLRNEAESLSKFYDADHPKVRDNQHKTELLEMLLKESHLGERTKELLPLLLKERKLLEKHGPKHPDVQATRKRIERMRDMLKELRSKENWAYFILIADQPPQPGGEAGAIGETDADTEWDAADQAEDR